MITKESIPLLNLNHSEVDLVSEYSNKNLLLLFYNNACLGCTGRAIPLAHELQKEFDDIQVVGIHSEFGKNISTKDYVMRIFTLKESPFPIYIDVNHNVYDSFQCEGTPHWILISKKGKILNSIFGSQAGAQTRLYYALESIV